MRSSAPPFRLLADPILPVNYERLCGEQYEMNRKSLVDRLQRLLIPSPSNLPIAVPDSTFRFTRTRDSRACAIRALSVKKF